MSRRFSLLRGLAVVAVVMAFVLAPVGVMMAEEAGGAPAATTTADDSSGANVTKGWGWGDTLKAMGSIGVVIVLLSVAGLALVIDFFVNVRRDKLIPQDVVSEVEQLFEQEQYEQAMELCDSEDCFFTRILGAGLAKLGAGYERMNEAIMQTAEEELTALNHKIGWLNVIGTVAPMLGLLGTVMGMIEAFNEIASSGGGASPAQLANGISKALVTTLLGLLVAIPVMTAYAFFKNRVTRVMLEVGAFANDLMDRFRPAQQ
jgi:biopolymer transport protein ExbB